MERPSYTFLTVVTPCPMFSTLPVAPQYNVRWGPRLYDHRAVRDDTSGWINSVKSGYRARGDTRTDDELLDFALASQRSIGTSAREGAGADMGAFQTVFHYTLSKALHLR